MTGMDSDADVITAIHDPMPGYERLALIKNGNLTDILISDMSDHTPAFGSIFMARVTNSFPDHGRVQLNIGQMGVASMRVAKPSAFFSGALIPVTVQAEPREHKPAQMRHGMIRETRFAIIHYVPDTSGQLHISKRLKEGLADQPNSDLMDRMDTLNALAAAHHCQITLRQSAQNHPIDIVMESINRQLDDMDDLVSVSKTVMHQGLLASAPSLTHVAERYVYPEQIMTDHDGRLWADADIDQHIDMALSPSLVLPEGGILHLSTPPGAAVIDGDSGLSRLSPDALASDMIYSLVRQIRLRRISGAVVIDFPRLDQNGRERIHQSMVAACCDDPLRPNLYGWTKGGLYTLERRHQMRPLPDVLDWHHAPAKYAAITGLRQLWQRSRNNSGSDKGLPPRLPLTTTAQDWLNHDGRPVRDAICADLPLPPEWITVQP
ncbi:MAG: ribonuclease E/G [Candidatus Puniceispirillales bacterium]